MSSFNQDNNGEVIRFGTYPVVTSARVNTNSIEDPLSDDGSESGYGIGSIWVNTLTKKVFVCVDSTTGSAVWKETTATGSGSLNMDDLGDVELTSPTNGQTLIFNTATGKWKNQASTSTDHGSLSGLLDDDHSQYYNQTRGDARYSLTTHTHTGTYEPANANIQSHIGNSNNPHVVTKSQVGLANVDNTSDLNKPISTATQSALDLKSATTHNHSGVYEPANANLQLHISSTSNPHNVTANQVLPSQTGNSGKYLTTNGTTTSWGTVSAGSSTLDALTDVVITSAANGQALQFNGTNWVNTTPSAGVTDHGLLTGLADDDHTQYHNDTRGDARYSRLPTTATVTTSTATPTTLQTYAVPLNTEKVIDFKVHGHQDTTDAHYWKRMTVGVKNVAGTTSIVGGVDSSLGYDASTSAWNILIEVSAGNVLITVTGESGKTINWRSTMETD